MKGISSIRSLLPLLSLIIQTANSQTGNYCGTSWNDAVSRCAMSCPTGAPTECIGGETCFAGTPCTEPAPETPPPVPPLPPQGGTCGNGVVGNGICPVENECCSFYGYCGTSDVHCDNLAVASNAAPSPSSATAAGDGGGGAPSIYGSCGGGEVGNGICANNNECCSMFGFCGTSDEHCSNKVGNFGPDTQTTPQVSVPAAPPIESYQSSSSSQTTPQVSVPAAPPIESYQSSQQTTPQYQLPAEQQTTPQGTVPAAPPQKQGFPVSSPTTTTQQQDTTTNEVALEGTCGSGSVGNGICPNNNECCSSYGFCGTTLEHCTNLAESSAPQQQSYQTTSLAMQTQPQAGSTGQTYATPNQPQAGQTYATQNQPQAGSTGQTYPQTQLYQPVAPHGTSKTIIGYYASWQWYDRDKLADPKNMDFRKVQRVNYAFFQPDIHGNIYGTDRWGDPQLLFGPYTEQTMGGIQKCSYDGPNEINCKYHEHNEGIVNLAHQAGAEVYPSIGGWTLSDNFPVLSADPVSRDKFAKSCAEIVKHYGFDGIDIDWEYPGYEAHSGTPADKINFTKMLQAIRAALDLLTRETGKTYGLTAALPCNPQHIENIEVGNLLNTLTEWNLMSYDFHGAWDTVTGVDAPLYPQGFGNDEFSIDRCVTNYNTLGVPKGKMNVGLPFYGRSFKHATALNQPHGGNDLASWPEDDGTPQYFNIHAKLPQMIQKRDNKSKTQYAYTSRLEQPGLQLPEGLVSFDDERAICDKVHYAQQHDMGGFIIWELSGDMLPDLRTPLLDITNKKLGNPAFECCLLHSQAECELEKEEEQNQNQWAPSGSWGGFDESSWTDTKYFDDSSSSASLKFELGWVSLSVLVYLYFQV